MILIVNLLYFGTTRARVDLRPALDGTEARDKMCAFASQPDRQTREGSHDGPERLEKLL